MNCNSYPKYKPSGVEWLSEVPEHWEIKRLKTRARCLVSNVDKVPSENEFPVRLCNYTDVYYNDFIYPEMEFMETTATYEEIQKFKLENDDVVITKDSEEWNDIAIAALVVKTAPDLVCGYHLAIIRPVKNYLSGGYLLRQLQSSEINHQFQLAATGVTRYGLPKSAIGESLIILPPLQEQQAISDFLDHETGKIDALVAKKKRLVELLREKRTALISAAVTKGLNPSVKFKPSGVEWLGEVPEHWGMGRLSFLTFKIGSGKTPLGGAEAYVNEGICFIRSQNVYNEGLQLEDVVYISEETNSEMFWSRVFPGDILLNITGASLGRTCIVPELFPEANVNQHVCIIRVTNKKYRPYLSWVMKSALVKFQIDARQTGAAREGLTFDQISKIIFPFPPLSEQDIITNFLDRETTKIDTLIAKIEAAIKKLTEYRTALISAAVTGKILIKDLDESVKEVL